jgi:prevent-host-death family protein
MSRYFPDTCSLSDFRENAAAHLKRLAKKNRPMLVTQNGKGKVVVLSLATYDNLLADIELQQSRARLELAHADIKAGRFLTVDEVEKRFKKLFSSAKQNKSKKKQNLTGKR